MVLGGVKAVGEGVEGSVVGSVGGQCGAGGGVVYTGGWGRGTSFGGGAEGL